MLSNDIEASISLLFALREDGELNEAFEKAVQMIVDCLQGGGRMFTAGNGGSAADAQHFAAELVGRFNKIERRALPAMSLTTDTSVLTAWSNDYDFETVFSRQIEAHGNKGDVLCAFTTSGNSKNIISAMMKAKEKGMITILFSGGGGGEAKGMPEVELLVPSSSTPRVQEVHTLLLHAISAEIEARMFGAG